MINPTEKDFRLRVPADHAAFRPLVDLFASDQVEQGRKAYIDITQGDVTSVMRVPFWARASKQREVHAILYPYAAGRDEAFKFAWPLIADCLDLCTVMVSCRGIEIQPPCPTIEKIPSFVSARRRVYLTATLSDDSVLVTNLKASLAAALNTALAGVVQAGRVRRSTKRKRTVTTSAAWTHENVYLVTSLPPRHAHAETVARMVREHWGCEVLHWQRDVVFGEDAQLGARGRIAGGLPAGQDAPHDVRGRTAAPNASC